jgi:pyruvate dehydrogenase complex dehydrogenase (E1) component
VANFEERIGIAVADDGVSDSPVYEFDLQRSSEHALQQLYMDLKFAVQEVSENWSHRFGLPRCSVDFPTWHS